MCLLLLGDTCRPNDTNLRTAIASMKGVIYPRSGNPCVSRASTRGSRSVEQMPRDRCACAYRAWLVVLENFQRSPLAFSRAPTHPTTPRPPPSAQSHLLWAPRVLRIRRAGVRVESESAPVHGSKDHRTRRPTHPRCPRRRPRRKRIAWSGGRSPGAAPWPSRRPTGQPRSCVRPQGRVNHLPPVHPSAGFCVALARPSSSRQS